MFPLFPYTPPCCVLQCLRFSRWEIPVLSWMLQVCSSQIYPRSCWLHPVPWHRRHLLPLWEWGRQSLCCSAALLVGDRTLPAWGSCPTPGQIAHNATPVLNDNSKGVLKKQKRRRKLQKNTEIKSFDALILFGRSLGSSTRQSPLYPDAQ